MKKVLRITAALLSAALLFAILCACTPSAKVQKRVLDYLNKKYKGLEFQLVDYSQDEKTSGRYRIHVLCVTNDVEFDIYYSTLLTTDSYSVCYANSLMEKQINEVIEPEAAEFINIESIQWFDLFEEGKSGYQFREVRADVSYDVKELKELYRIRLDSELFEGEGAIYEVVQSIYMAIDVLAAKGIVLDRVTFEFTAEGKTFLFETNTKSVKKADLKGLEAMFATAEVTLEPGENLFTDKKINKLEMFIEEPTEEVENQ